MQLGRVGLNVLVLATCQAMLNTMGSILATVSAVVGASLASEAALATLPVSLTVVGTAGASIPASLLMKRTGRRTGFIIGAVIGLAGALLAAYGIYQRSFATFCAAAAVLGVFTGFGNFYRFAAADAAPARLRSRTISYVLAGGVVAGFVGPALAKGTRSAIAGVEFAGCFLAIAGLAVLTALLVSLIKVPRTTDVDSEATRRPLREIVRRPAFVAAVVGAAVGTAVMSLIMTATPLAMIGHGHSFDNSATVIQWHVVAMFLPSFVTGSLVARYGAIPVMLAGSVSLFGAMGIGLVGTEMSHFFAALILLGLGWNFLFISGSSLLTTVHSDAERAKTQAANDFIVYGCVAVASLSSGWLLSRFGWAAVNVGALIVLAIATLALVWLWGKLDPSGRV